MAISLRTRLTLWYSALLLLALGLFSATVLWLHWRLLTREVDRSLDALVTAAANMVAEELTEGDTLPLAAKEMMDVVPHGDYTIAVLDAAGAPILALPAALPVRSPADAAADSAPWTAKGFDGRRWRLMQRSGAVRGQAFSVAIAAPLHALDAQWRTLVDASAIGVPFVLAVAAFGGWLLGRRGLRPLADIAEQARGVTARTPDNRIAVADAGVELDAVAASFNHVLDRLGTALATQRQFMADASHELRTPVSIMRTAADVTLSRPNRDEAEYRDALGAVAEQSSRLARLVDDMLVLARADAGGYPMIRAEVDLDGIVDDCVREFSPRAAEKDIRLTSSVQPVSVVADAALLRRMLGNLLGNALVYTPPGGTVDVRMVPDAGGVSIHVADTGPGIALRDQQRIFDRFVRLDPARAEGGAGLGLSIARWIAEAHGGRVELLRSDPTGSVFAATIPA
jgi:heavy metal sensor kinase